MILQRSYEIMGFAKRIFANGIQSVCGWITGVAAILAPSVPLIGTSFAFILIDLYYGYKVSKKYSKNTHFESVKFWKTVEKLGFAAIMICCFTLLDKFIFATYDDLVLAKAAAGTICFAEFISLLEALRALKPDSTIAKLLTKLIKSKAEKYLDLDISDVIDENNSK